MARARFSTKEFEGRAYDETLRTELEEKVKQFLYEEGCYGSAAVANVIIELMWEAIRVAKVVK